MVKLNMAQQPQKLSRLHGAISKGDLDAVKERLRARKVELQIERLYQATLHFFGD